MKQFYKVEENLAAVARIQARNDCPSIEHIESAAENGKRSSHFDVVTSHIAECKHCFELYRDMRSVEALRPTASTWPEKFRQWLGTSESATEGNTSLPNSVASLVARALSRPAVAGSYRSAQMSAKPVQLISPLAGNAALSGVPTLLEWDAVEQATQYEVRLEECLDSTCRSFREVPEAYDVDGCSATLDADALLLTGSRYRIVIRPDVDHGFSLEPTESVYVFDILGSVDSRNARWAFDNADRAPISAALSLFELGLYADADRIASQWPAEPDLDAFRNQIAEAAQRQADSSGIG